MYISIVIAGKHLIFASFGGLDLGSKLQTVEFPSREFQKYKFAIRSIRDNIASLRGDEHLDGIAISISGEVDPTSGLLLDSYSYPSWSGNNLAHDLEQFGCPVVVENDAASAALGQYFDDSEAGKRQGYIYFARDGGIGAAVVERLDSNVLIYPIEFGHMIIVPDGRACECGQKGCLEQYIAAKGIEASYDITPGEVNDDEIFVTTARYFTQSIMTLLVFYPLDVLHIGGEDPALQRTFLPNIIAYSREMLERKFTGPKPTLVMSEPRKSIEHAGNLALLAHRDAILNMHFAGK